MDLNISPVLPDQSENSIYSSISAFQMLGKNGSIPPLLSNSYKSDKINNHKITVISSVKIKRYTLCGKTKIIIELWIGSQNAHK